MEPQNLKNLVTVRKIDAVKRIEDYEVLVIDGLEFSEFHAARDVFHAGEYCIFVERGVMLPAHPKRRWTPTAKTETVQLYPLDEFPEIAEEMMMLSHDHDGFTAEDYAQIRTTDFAARFGVKPAV
jgi:hypothetical protein